MKYPSLVALPIFLLPMHSFSQTVPPGQSLDVYTLRLLPGEDLKVKLTEFVELHRIEAGFMLTGVGSLTDVILRLANQEEGSQYRGHFEIDSLVGTLSIHGSHLHISVSDSTGKTIGVHLLDGNIVYTTAELVVG